MTYLAIDHGAGNLKLHGIDGSVIIPTRAATAQEGYLSAAIGLKVGKPPQLVAADGWTIYVGENAPHWGRNLDDLSDGRFSTGAPGVRAVTYAALAEYVTSYSVNLDDLAVYVGLPHTALNADNAKATVAGVKGWLKGTHQWSVDGVQFEASIVEVFATTQVAGALYDYLLDDNGDFKPGMAKLYRSGEIAVLSLGMNTCELMVTDARTVTQNLTGGDTFGVRRLLEMTDPGNLYTRGELDMRLRAGRLDISETLPVWLSEIDGYRERKWGRAWRRFQPIIVIGGGLLIPGVQAHIIAKLQGRAVIPDDPVGAVARGIRKFAQQRVNRKRSGKT